MGSGVYQALERNGTLLSGRLGTRLEVNRVVVRDPDKKRNIAFPREILHTGWRAAVEDRETDIVVELIGGTTTAREVVEHALRLGKPVVTANKALLSDHGESLFALARRSNAGLHYEASVAGGIPIIKVLREGLAGNRILGMYGILNGTCNYILTRMERAELDFDHALRQAQRKGYAEADPTLDVDGLDAMHKAGILASLASGMWVPPASIHVEGIRAITRKDIEFAARLGYRIKLLASIRPEDGFFPDEASGEGRLQVSVCPTLISEDHPLATIHGVDNAVWLVGDVVGELLFSGPGAGREATASAVLADLIDATRNQAPPTERFGTGGSLRAWDEMDSEYFIRLRVADRPGTMAAVAGVLSRAGIGISSIIQPEQHGGSGETTLILMVHDAPNRIITGALDRIGELPVVKSPPMSLRVEHFEALERTRNRDRGSVDAEPDREERSP